MRLQYPIKSLYKFEEEGNYRWIVYMLVSGLLMSLGVGCASVKSVFYHEPHEIAKLDARARSGPNT